MLPSDYVFMHLYHIVNFLIPLFSAVQMIEIVYLQFASHFSSHLSECCSQAKRQTQSARYYFKTASIAIISLNVYIFNITEIRQKLSLFTHKNKYDILYDIKKSHAELS